MVWQSSLLADNMDSRSKGTLEHSSFSQGDVLPSASQPEHHSSPALAVWVPSLPGWGRSVAGQALVFLAGVMCVFLHDVFHQKLGQGIRSYIDVPGANFARGLLRLVPTDKLRPA